MLERYLRSLFPPVRPLFLRLQLLAALILLPLIPALAADLHVDSLLDSPALHGGVSACIVERLDDGTVVYDRNADTRLMPASNRKLFTTASVLGLLGPDFTLTTPVLAVSHPDRSGTLHGDIYIKGTGDSLLTTADFDELGQRLAAKGIKKVTGGVVADGSVFEDGPFGTNWGWDTLDDDYAPAITGLEANDGLVRIDVTPGSAIGNPVLYLVLPKTYVAPVIDLATTAPAGTKANIHAHRPWRRDYILLTGTLPLGGSKSLDFPVTDPVLYACDLFRSSLIRAGISVEGPPSTGRVPVSARVVLAEHKSPPMRDYIRSMNKPSDNLLAESLIRVIGRERSRHGDYDHGNEAEMAFFKSIGLNTDVLSLDDGSGVSRRNFVTARSIVDLLIWEAKQPYFNAFEASLPVAGVDGTLRHRMTGTPAAENVHAKTGTLTGACALSGYFTGASGKRYAFSILMNNYPSTATDVRGIEDQVMVDLVTNL